MEELDDNEKQTIINLLIEYSKTIGIDNMEALNQLYSIVCKLKEESKNG
jgi:hypothetical protein